MDAGGCGDADTGGSRCPAPYTLSSGRPLPSSLRCPRACRGPSFPRPLCATLPLPKISLLCYHPPMNNFIPPLSSRMRQPIPHPIHPSFPPQKITNPPSPTRLPTFFETSPTPETNHLRHKLIPGRLSKRVKRVIPLPSSLRVLAHSLPSRGRPGRGRNGCGRPWNSCRWPRRRKSGNVGPRRRPNGRK